MIYYCGLNQFIVQRNLAAKSLKHGQLGMIFAGGLWLLVPFAMVMPGLMAQQLYGDETRRKNRRRLSHDGHPAGPAGSPRIHLCRHRRRGHQHAGLAAQLRIDDLHDGRLPADVHAQCLADATRLARPRADARHSSSPDARSRRCSTTRSSAAFSNTSSNSKDTSGPAWWRRSSCPSCCRKSPECRGSRRPW